MKRAKSRARRPAKAKSALQSLGDSTRKVGRKVKRSAARMLHSLGETTKVVKRRAKRKLAL